MQCFWKENPWKHTIYFPHGGKGQAPVKLLFNVYYFTEMQHLLIELGKGRNILKKWIGRKQNQSIYKTQTLALTHTHTGVASVGRMMTQPRNPLEVGDLAQFWLVVASFWTEELEVSIEALLLRDLLSWFSFHGVQVQLHFPVCNFKEASTHHCTHIS